MGRGFHGAYEVRTIEQRDMVQTVVEDSQETFQGHSPTKKKRTSTSSWTATSNAAADTGSEPSEEAMAADFKQQDALQLKTKQFRIIDWTYYCLVVMEMNSLTRSRALCFVVQNSD